MRHVANVAGRELRSLFVSPVAYGLLSLFAVLAGFFFITDIAWFVEQVFRAQQFQAFDRYMELNLNDNLIFEFYGTMTVVLLFLIPGITMGLYASEKTNGTQELLMTSPLTIWDIVLGKFLGAALFVAILVAIVGVFPGILFLYGDPEAGKTLSGLLGLLLVGWTYVSVGAFASSFSRSQVIAFFATFVLLLFFLLIPAFSDLGVASGAGPLAEVFRWVSPVLHFEQLGRGLVDTADLAFFVVMVGTFLVMTKASVESVRWR